MIVSVSFLICLALPAAKSSVIWGLTSVPHRSNVTDVVLYERHKRQLQCPIYEWQCSVGTCIPVDGKCDGIVDCPDGSDETHALCRSTKCQRNWFRCTYGACVDGTAPCNGVMECRDQSDELLPSCRNETINNRGKFRCLDGNAIPVSDACDGIPHCPDGSDETVRACAAHTCPAHLFQCAYGACVDQRSDCNGRKDCVDGSDEAVELCTKKPSGNNRINPPINTPAVVGPCKLPPYPENGRYVVTNAPYAGPGQAFQSALLNISCDPGYGVVGSDDVFCQEGKWSDQMPECVLFCKLDAHPSVEYHCRVAGSLTNERPCSSAEPTGTVVRPECRKPNYFTTTTLFNMRCVNGQWNYIATCNPECGRLTPDGVELISGGRPVMRGELPWHVGIYRKPTTRKNYYEQICGGSLVSNNVVISAAHCFWDDIGKQQPASKYAVAIAKLFRDWDHPDDKDAQKSNLKSIELPQRFQGRQANFQEDIALLILETPFEYYNYVRPVCLDLESRSSELEEGRLGKVAGWGLTGENGNASDILKVVELPHVDIQKCIDSSPATFKENLTGDKICAGYTNGTALCKGDSGGGLAFPEPDRKTVRYYLRGIASTAPRNNNPCNIYTVTTFTQISRHQHFITRFL